MADVKISGLPAATTPLAGTEVLPIVQSSTTKKVSIADVTAGRAVSASSLTATNLKTSPATANLDISGTTIAASGSDANVDVNINAKGTGVAYLNQRWGVNQSGALVASAGNTYDIGNGTNNPRDVNIDRYAVMNALTASKAVFTDASKNLTTTGTVDTTQGGTGLTSFTANGVVYASSTSALATGSAITFDGTNFATTGSATATRFIPSGSTVATNGMYLPAANSLGFSTNSINAMYINSSQQTILGATTTSTQAKLEVAFDQALTTLGESRRLILNDLRGGTNERTEIGFGYASTTTQPAVIGYQTTSNTSSTKGILYFATRDVTTNTAPTERMRIHTTGGVSIGNTTDPGATNLSVTGSVSTANAITGIRNNITSTDRISVTGATTIFSTATGGSSVGASGAVILVNGYNTASNTNSFIDLVLFIGSNTPTVLGSVNRGSPAARTYTASGSNLQLAMASGTYNVASSSTEQAC